MSALAKLALFWPSFEVVREVLAERGMVLNVRTIRRLCRDVGQRGLEERGAISLERSVQVPGQTLVIGVAGGRVRERTPRRGKKTSGQTRRGDHTDWREPNLLTGSGLDAEGKMRKTVAPMQDAPLGKAEALLAREETSGREVELSSLARIVFTGDGAPGIGTPVAHRIGRLGRSPDRVFQVLADAHASPKLSALVELARPIGNAPARELNSPAVPLGRFLPPK